MYQRIFVVSLLNVFVFFRSFFSHIEILFHRCAIQISHWLVLHIFCSFRIRAIGTLISWCTWFGFFVCCGFTMHIYTISLSDSLFIFKILWWYVCEFWRIDTMHLHFWHIHGRIELCVKERKCHTHTHTIIALIIYGDGRCEWIEQTKWDVRNTWIKWSYNNKMPRILAHMHFWVLRHNRKQSRITLM